MSPVAVGARNHGQQGGGGGGKLGELPDGVYPIVMRWGLRSFPEGKYKASTKLSLFVEATMDGSIKETVAGQNITERLGAGNGAGIVLSADFKALDEADPGWQLNPGTKAAAFLAEFEKSLGGGDLETTMLAYEGAQVQIRRMRYSGKVGDDEANKPGGPTYPCVLEARAPARPLPTSVSPALAPPAPQPMPPAPPAAPLPFAPLGSPVPAGVQPGPLPPATVPGTRDWARETIMAMLTASNQQPIAMAQVPPEDIMPFLPTLSNDSDKIKVIKCVLSPDFLGTEMGWTYDRQTHVVSNQIPF
ncbi:hypothetical protein LCGC14_0723280 [marine sediment metagenome]|uniref:Uncharacterized protein n=1 Tax=marine sediment metagenome TaxID=412755 RepID=A0A0F9QWS8_9ZZZZ